ncbi:MAG: hypothetical protein R2941_22480 [Desulfobacterales bacterium]
MMAETASEKFKKSLDAAVSRCIEKHEVLKVSRKNGKAFIVIGEKDWKAIEKVWISSLSAQKS